MFKKSEVHGDKVSPVQAQIDVQPLLGIFRVSDCFLCPPRDDLPGAFRPSHDTYTACHVWNSALPFVATAPSGIGAEPNWSHEYSTKIQPLGALSLLCLDGHKHFFTFRRVVRSKALAWASVDNFMMWPTLLRFVWVFAARWGRDGGAVWAAKRGCRHQHEKEEIRNLKKVNGIRTQGK